MVGKFEAKTQQSKPKRFGKGLVAGICATVLLGACVGPTITHKDFRSGAVVQKSEIEKWKLMNISVQIPETMEVSNDPLKRYPDSDKLVWYGDGPGDVKKQVANLLTESVAFGTNDVLVGDEPVEVVIRVRQFHAMTPRARISNLQLGVHEIVFDIEVRNQKGELVASEQGVNADLRAFSGVKAYEAEAKGLTQRKRIKERVAEVVRRWLAPWSTEEI